MEPTDWYGAERGHASGRCLTAMCLLCLLYADGVAQYNDMLMRDLGLNRHRAGGGWWKELTAVYGPRSYAGIVNEWTEVRAGGRE